jgi:hypothetical protein
MGDIYFGAVRTGTLVRVPPAWIASTIVQGGSAVLLEIAEPAGLFVVKRGAMYVAVAGAGTGAATRLAPDQATPFRVYVVASESAVYYIQIPAGPLDRPSSNVITVLAPNVEKGGVLVTEMDTKNPNPRLGWKPA